MSIPSVSDMMKMASAGKFKKSEEGLVSAADREQLFHLFTELTNTEKRYVEDLEILMTVHALSLPSLCASCCT